MPTGVYDRSKSQRVYKPLSEEMKLRLRLANVGRKLSVEAVEKIRRGNTGKKKSFEDRQAISRRMIGNKHGLGHRHSPETREVFRQKARRGPASNFWKGGTTEEAKIIRQSSQYREWRRQVFERDNYTCQVCSKRGGKLHPDHIKRFSMFPELRFDVSNGRTLCEDCHKQTPTYGRRKACESILS